MGKTYRQKSPKQIEFLKRTRRERVKSRRIVIDTKKKDDREENDRDDR